MMPVVVPLIVKGPSPRVRGSRRTPQGCRHSAGSIPARAGQPTIAARARTRRKVHPRAYGAAGPSGGVQRVVVGSHPRVCGAAPMSAGHRQVIQGPSPRVRGSPFDAELIFELTRSIPARTGQPRLRQLPTHQCRVHPRACGAAWSSMVIVTFAQGPSPRVRGSTRH